MRHAWRWVSRAMGVFILGAATAAAQEPADAAAAAPDAVPAHSPRPEWARQLTPDQEMLVGQLLLERLNAVAALERGPDRLRQARQIERRLQEKLAEFLTPEQVSGYRAGVPAILMNEPNAKMATAADSCDDGYSELDRACTEAVLARDRGQDDLDFHDDHNPYSANNALAGTYLKRDACEARDIAAAARNDCQLADDAAARAQAGIGSARQQYALAIDSSNYCFTYEGHINYSADAAALHADAAENRMITGRAHENACFDCCAPDVDAPTGIYALAQGASSIKITWQDRSAETHFPVQKSENGGTYHQIAKKVAGATLHVDPQGSSEANNRYRVAALNETCGIQGPWSAIAIVPKSPNNLTFTRSGNNVTLFWNDRSTLETKFEIHRKLGTAGWELFLTVPGNQESKGPIALQPGVQRFRVRATTPTGASWYTNEVSVTR